MLSTNSLSSSRRPVRSSWHLLNIETDSPNFSLSSLIPPTTSSASDIAPSSLSRAGIRISLTSGSNFSRRGMILLILSWADLTIANCSLRAFDCTWICSSAFLESSAITFSAADLMPSASSLRPELISISSRATRAYQPSFLANLLTSRL